MKTEFSKPQSREAERRFEEDKIMPSQKLKSLDGSRNVFVGRPGLELSRKQRSTPLALLILLVSSLLSFPCASLHAQANTGLTGRVTDPSGATIPGAHITFINEATGIRTQTAASSVGLYTTSLPAGTYDITVEAPGFEKFEQTHLVVEVGAEATNDIKLTMGSVNQTVEVSSQNTIQMDTTDPQL